MTAAKPTRAERSKAQAEQTRSAMAETPTPKKRLIRSKPSVAPKTDSKAPAQQSEPAPHSLAIDVPGLPREGRPFGIEPGQGAHIVSTKATTELGSSFVVVELDAGAFRWLWEAAERDALVHHRKYGGINGMGSGSDAAKRAVESMRKSGHAAWPSKYRASNGKTKRVVRRTSQDDSDTKPKVKRVVRRNK